MRALRPNRPDAEGGSFPKQYRGGKGKILGPRLRGVSVSFPWISARTGNTIAGGAKGYLKDEDAIHVEKLTVETGKILSGLINSLRAEHQEVFSSKESRQLVADDL